MPKLIRVWHVPVHALLRLAILPVAAAAQAQAIDPEALRSIQRSLGAGETTVIERPVEPSRAPGSDAGGQIVGGAPVVVDTLEEQQLRRARARSGLEALYTPTAVERDFRVRLGDSSLRQFGYDVLQAAPAPTGGRTGAVSDSYVLGIGDEVQVVFRGATNDSRTARVDRDGRLIVGQLRPIQAAGRTLAAVRAEVQAETRATLLATDAFVSVGQVRAISVFVGGEVERPGQYQLSSLADVATAIAQAGGVRRTGTLRQLRLVRAGGGTVLVDLYPFLGIGAPTTLLLRDGDRIIVPVIGQTVAVTGAVARPGIYELRGPALARDVIAYAGGPLRGRGADIVISRISADGAERFLRGVGREARVQAGDALILVGLSAGGPVGRVALLGHVDNAGPRPLATARTVAELVGPIELLRPGTYQAAAILERVEPGTGARLFETVNLARELRGLTSTPLRNQDRLFLFARSDIAFLNSLAVRTVVLGEQNPLPQCSSLTRLSQLVRDTRSARFAVATRGSLVVRAGAGQAAIGAAGVGLEDVVRDTAILQRGMDAAATPCPAIFEQEVELLPVLLENSVAVTGAVRQPGAYPVAGSATAFELMALAEGLVPGTVDLSLDVTRAIDGSFETLSLGDDDMRLSQVQLAVGDDVRFNGRQPSFESSAVLVSGEVVRPGLYTIRKGETLSQLLARAGGLTEHAYPYGAIFTRQRVRVAEQEGYRRTARELNNSLLAITARSESRGTEGLQGAAALIQLLANAEATGRVVVEADPRVLAIRPDLDTLLEAGDSISIPRRPNFVLALGDLLNPGALQFVDGKTAQSYIRDAGGTLATADDGRAYVVLPNGVAQPIRSGLWAGRNAITPPPGSTVVVPKNIDPLYRLSIFRDVSTIIANLAVSAATIGVLATN
ncbi:SLBB domain-containing protein [Thermaurantiacus sp.]